MNAETLPVADHRRRPGRAGGRRPLRQPWRDPDRPRGRRRGRCRRPSVGARARVLARGATTSMRSRPPCWRRPAGRCRTRSTCPTGRELVDGVSRAAGRASGDPAVPPSRHSGHPRQLAVGVDKLRTDGRETAPFVLRVLTPAGEEQEILARAVIDASGTYGSPNPLGADGTSARGEATVHDRVFYGIPDVLGTHRARYAGRRVAVIGSGHSALNTLLDLAELAKAEPRTDVTWIVRRPPPARVFGGGAADALAGPRCAGPAGAPAPGAWRRHARRGAGRRRSTRQDDGVAILDEAGSTLATVDELVAVTGLRPDLTPLRELRLELDPIMEAPRALAPLIDPNVHSCGTVPPHGEAELAPSGAGLLRGGHEELRPSADLPHADRLRAGAVDRVRADRRMRRAPRPSSSRCRRPGSAVRRFDVRLG